MTMSNRRPASHPAPRASLAELLRARGEIVPARAEQADARAMWRSGDIPADAIAHAVAAAHGLVRGERNDVAAMPHLMEGLSPRFLRDAAIYPVSGPDGPLLAVADPGDIEAIEAVAVALDGRPRLVVLSFDEIEDLLNADGMARPERNGPAAPQDLGLAGSFAPSLDAETLEDLARGAPIVRAIDTMLERAVEANATDIHIEMTRDALQIRFRIDGQLRVQQILPKEAAAAIVSRVKILAGLDIAERRLPQDGRASIRVKTVEADLRVAVMPTMHGETAVLRILMKDTRLLDFARVGCSLQDRVAIEALLTEPHGLIIVTGPTGSGKTTTLATAISRLNDPVRKIMTIEDPVEYQFPGVHQTQIKPAIGLTFASALRSFLRHDPDVIMVGEMRDGETAGIGIQAALTGHLVLTTLHTNGAPEAVIRLGDMGVEPYLVASCLRGVVGQRLVRRLCERCRTPDPAAGAIAQALAARRAIRLPQDPHLHRPVGCPSCSGSGYRGRIGVFEVMAVDDMLRALICERPDPGSLARAAAAAGMRTMLEDGLSKAALGLTSVEEILRVTG